MKPGLALGFVGGGIIPPLLMLLMDTGRRKYLQSMNRSPLSSEGPSSTGKKIRLSNNLSGEFSSNDIDNG
ncbi:hypothetical protein OROMI_011118 [Orobanche minor]